MSLNGLKCHVQVQTEITRYQISWGKAEKTIKQQNQNEK